MTTEERIETVLVIQDAIAEIRRLEAENARLTRRNLSLTLRCDLISRAFYQRPGATVWAA